MNIFVPYETSVRGWNLVVEFHTSSTSAWQRNTHKYQ